MNKLVKNSDLHFPLHLLHLQCSRKLIFVVAQVKPWGSSLASSLYSPANPSAPFVKSTFKMPGEFIHFLSCSCYHPGLSHHHASLGYCSCLLTSLPKCMSGDHIIPLLRMLQWLPISFKVRAYVLTLRA